MKVTVGLAFLIHNDSQLFLLPIITFSRPTVLSLLN
jgi:hypothetical protein